MRSFSPLTKAHDQKCDHEVLSLKCSVWNASARLQRVQRAGVPGRRQQVVEEQVLLLLAHRDQQVHRRPAGLRRRELPQHVRQLGHEQLRAPTQPVTPSALEAVTQYSFDMLCRPLKGLKTIVNGPTQ